MVLWPWGRRGKVPVAAAAGDPSEDDDEEEEEEEEEEDEEEEPTEVTCDESYNELGDDGIAALCANLDPLVANMDLGGNQITSEGARTLGEALPSLPHLRVLDLRDNQLRAGLPDLLKGMEGCQKLEYLDISSNYVRDHGLESLSHCLQYHVRKLKILEVTDNGLGREAAVALGAALASGCGLTTIGIGFNHLGDTGARALAAGLERNKILQSLDVSDNRIGDEGCGALADVLGRCKLLRLNLSVNTFGAKGIEALSTALEASPPLQHLDVGANEVGSTTASGLFGSLIQNRTLTSLDMSNCKLTDECIPDLEECLRQNDRIVELQLLVNDLRSTEGLLPLMARNADRAEEREARRKRSRERWQFTVRVLGVVSGLCLLFVCVYLAWSRWFTT